VGEQRHLQERRSGAIPGSLPESELPGDPGYGAIRAIDPKKDQKVWEHKMQSKPCTGVLSIGGRFLFGGTGGAYRTG
jgi:hypothetical protein